MNRTELVDLVKSGRKVTIMLAGAQIVSAKKELRPINHYKCATLYKIVVNDPIWGTIYFGGYSGRLHELYSQNIGKKVSLKVTVTGIGTPTTRYPEPMLFAKPHLKKSDPFVVDYVTTEDFDLSVNV